MPTQDIDRRVVALDSCATRGRVFRLAEPTGEASIGTSEAGGELGIQRDDGGPKVRWTELQTGDLTKGSTAFASTFFGRFYWGFDGAARQNQYGTPPTEKSLRMAAEFALALRSAKPLMFGLPFIRAFAHNAPIPEVGRDASGAAKGVAHIVSRSPELEPAAWITAAVAQPDDGRRHL